jgi:hypothetical protein
MTILKSYAFLSKVFDDWLEEVRTTRYDFISHILEEVDYQQVNLTKSEFIEKFKKPFEGYTRDELEHILFLFNSTCEGPQRFCLKSFNGNYDFNRRLEWIVFHVSKLSIQGFILGSTAKQYVRNVKYQCEYCGMPLGYLTKKRYCWTTKEEQLNGATPRHCEKNWKNMYNRVHNFYDIEKQKKAQKAYTTEDYNKQFIEYCEEFYALSLKFEFPIYYWKH